MARTTLLDTDGSTTDVELRDAPDHHRPTQPLVSRVAYAAAHVIPRPWADNVPGSPAEIDWDATLAYRRHLYSWGLGVADAMDTAQRNMGLDAAATRELITRSAETARESGGRLVAGVNTDHVEDEVISLDAVIDAYKEQLHFTEDAGAGVVLMASRHLARTAQSPADFERVYREVLEAAAGPIVLAALGLLREGESGEYGKLVQRKLPEHLSLVFVPSLAALLIHAERLNGAALTEAQVLAIRDRSMVMAVPHSKALAVQERRGYADVDAADAWNSWLKLRDNRT